MRAWLPSLIILASCSGISHAQDAAANLTGTVIGELGGPIRGAEVQLREQIGKVVGLRIRRPQCSEALSALRYSLVL